MGGGHLILSALYSATTLVLTTLIPTAAFAQTNTYSTGLLQGIIMTISPLNLYPIIILLLALIVGIDSYVVEGLALFHMGKRTGISSAWVAMG